MTERQWQIVLLGSLVLALLGLCAIMRWNPLEALLPVRATGKPVPKQPVPKQDPVPVDELILKGTDPPLSQLAHDLTPGEATAEEIEAVSTVFKWVSWRADHRRYRTTSDLLAHTRTAMKEVIDGNEPPYQSDKDWNTGHAPVFKRVRLDEGDADRRYVRWVSFSIGIAERLSKDDKDTSGGLTIGDLVGRWLEISSGLDKALADRNHRDGNR